MRILVTGASGLVGRHILARMSKEKSISLIAQYQNHSLPEWRLAGITRLQLALDTNMAEELLTATSPDIIVHCAAKIPTTASSAEQVAEVNRKIDTIVCRAADRCGAQVLYISSVSVYENSDCPWAEENMLSPFSAYAQQKLESEIIFSKLHVTAASFRISSPYGGWQNAERNVLYRFIHAAVNDEVLKIFGAGSRRQDFIYAPDIADAVWSLVSARLSNIEIGGVFNIAGGTTISMRELGEMVIGIARSGSVLRAGQADPQEGFDPQIDIRRAVEVLGWKPHTKLASGIQNVIASLRN